ncbi:hypothetical protein SJ2017_3717 [Shewanella japonica]|uniref:DUF3859 domain-containing protein n=2 Tax=Shewanellaceae TaxID=267890 RepID=A0ABM6JQ06_9GAMM|nr:hypothetical protein SJ2017_3717 [Shewanella japonica]
MRSFNKITCILFLLMTFNVSASGLASLLSDAIEPEFSKIIDDIYTGYSLIEDDLPEIPHSAIEIPRDIFIPDYNSTFSCGGVRSYNSDYRAIEISYTVYFQTSKETWIPLDGKVQEQSFWQVNPVKNTTAWINKEE